MIKQQKHFGLQLFAYGIPSSNNFKHIISAHLTIYEPYSIYLRVSRSFKINAPGYGSGAIYTILWKQYI